MQIEKQSKKNNKRSRPQEQMAKQTNANKDLLRLERDIFSLKKSQQNESQYVIRKLMAKKEKPQIGMVNESPLLSRLKQMMPIFKKSNQELQLRPVQQSEKIDVRLEQCESSSSSSDSDAEGQESQEKQTEKLQAKIHDMEIQQTNNSSQNEMQNEAQQVEGNFVQINFLRYPYLNEEQAAALEKQKLQKGSQTQEKKQKQKLKKVLIEQIPQQHHH